MWWIACAPADEAGWPSAQRAVDSAAGRIEETVPDQPELEDAWLFSEGTIHEVAVEMDLDAWNALGTDPYEYVLADVVIDGYRVEDVGLRLRGKIGSFRTLDGKPKLKIAFDEYIDDQRFFGLKELSLNNSVVDCSYLKESLAYRVFRDAGVPAGRTSFSSVWINGVDYGLYVLVETPDDVFLEEHWPEGTGNLYDGKYWYDNGSYVLIDFVDSLVPYFQLEEGEDVGLADVQAVTDRIEIAAGSGAYAAQMDELVDWAAIHPYLAVEQWIGHNDGYSLNTNNYRVHFDPADGKAEFVPWDFDYAFLNDYDWGMSWSSPRGVMVSNCWADAACAEAQRNAAISLVEGLDVDTLAQDFELWAALTDEAARSDPRRECDVSYVDSYRDYLRAWIAGRNDWMRARWSF